MQRRGDNFYSRHAVHLMDLPPHLQALVAQAIAVGVEAGVKAALSARQEPAPKPEDARSMAELWPAYLATLTNEQSLAAYRSARNAGDIPFPWQGRMVKLSELTFGQLTKPLLEDWMNFLLTTKNKRGGKFATTSVDHYRRAWQAMIGWYVTREEFPRNPFKGLPLRTEDEEDGWRMQYITREQLETLAPYAPDVFMDMWRFARRAGGLRNTEMRTLKRDQIDFEAKEGWCIRKGGKVWTFVIPDDALEIARRWHDWSRSVYLFPNRNGKAYSRQAVDRAFRIAADKAGLRCLGNEKAVPHGLRHGWFVEELEKAQPESHVAAQGGHKSTDQLRRYGRLRGTSKDAYRERANMTPEEVRKGPVRTEPPTTKRTKSHR